VNAPNRVVLGRVAGAHALRGEIRVKFFGDEPTNLLQVPEVWLGRGRSDTAARRFEVLRTGHGRAGEVRLALQGVDDRDGAIALRGLFVLADAAGLAPLPDGEFYWHELIGCEVVGRDGSEIGTVQEIWDTGAHDVLVVEAEAGERYLLSTARELMPEVDLEAGRITVELLPGMLAPVPRESR
jgi:16S rRNA processing protein RimM